MIEAGTVPIEIGEQSIDVRDPTSFDVRLYLLQRFELVAGGRAVSLPASAQRLLAFLAVEQREVPRTLVAFNLWPDKPEARSIANLRSALWRLRLHGSGLVESTASHVRLGRDVEVDYAAALAQTRAWLDTDLPDSAHHDEALLRGDLLPDWYDDWVVTDRERLRQSRLHAIEHRCAGLLGAGRCAEAIDLALRAVADEPLRESAHRLLLRAHHQEGNAAEALRQYETYRYRMHTELGLLPSEQMERLVREVREGGAPDHRAGGST